MAAADDLVASSTMITV